MENYPATWLTTRTAGVLAHVSSLPGAYGIGNLGSGARAFIDFLADARVRYWQICPIGPTGFGDSPYQLFSGRAGNPYFIDLGELRDAGLLEPAELAPLQALPASRVDYGRLYELFWPVLTRAALGAGDLDLAEKTARELNDRVNSFKAPASALPEERGVATLRLGQALCARGRKDEALPLLREAVILREKLDDPGSPWLAEARRLLSNCQAAAPGASSRT